MAWSRVLSFIDPLPCQAAFPHSDIEILPTSKDFRAEMTQVAMSRLWLQRTHLSSPTVSTATCKPGRRSIGFLTESNLSPYHHCGIEVMPGDIIDNTLKAEHRRCGPGLDYGSMSIPTDELDTAVETIIGCELMEKSERHIFRPHPQSMSRLLTLHRAIGRLANDTPDILQLPEVLRALENELVHVMVRCLADTVDEKTCTRGRGLNAIMARFEEFLEANPDRPLYMAEICAAIGVPERTLRAACEEHLGMGPIRFLTLRRLHLVHRALLSAVPSTSTVTRIATDHGFCELGRFAATYRATFGESPCETLKRPTQQIAVRLNRPSSLVAAEANA
ncbi:helix-turn-helix domain-containing protein [Bradyrhizobium neotropicale]|uniref:AraC family transcriptional regulator n=1 Tax=Bradyrhizobium neotropicale TaxID=1497615 RepID=UPI001AD78146|nr:helix-turn-helix domain-containing protein [Bradyrhizobium neotropicale]MBO4226660.1 helix-turn-helix domain-containing protein [Bradyrhizobium neotropicale]